MNFHNISLLRLSVGVWFFMYFNDYDEIFFFSLLLCKFSNLWSLELSIQPSSLSCIKIKKKIEKRPGWKSFYYVFSSCSDYDITFWLYFYMWESRHHRKLCFHLMNTTIYSKQKHKFSYHRVFACFNLCCCLHKVNLQKKRKIEREKKRWWWCCCKSLCCNLNSLENSIFFCVL